MGTVPVEKPMGIIEDPVPGILNVPLPYGADVVDTAPLGVNRTVPEDKIDTGAVPLRGVYVTALEGTDELADPFWRALEVPLP